MSDNYNFNAADAFELIKSSWTRWANNVGATKWVVGISGGKDSSVVAALDARIFGKDNVIGVLMPNGEQSDINDSKEVCDFLGIKPVEVNIGKAYEELLDEVVFGALKPLGVEKASEDTLTNLPARLRMATLYAVAQSVGGIVLNTCNLSEDTVGYSSLFGDNAGSYAPIQGLTVTEVIALGDWLGLPRNLTHKTPVDGLQPKTDEEKLGFTYSALDLYIRQNEGSKGLKDRIDELYRRNKFKTDIVGIPGPYFGFPNFVEDNYLANNLF